MSHDTLLQEYDELLNKYSRLKTDYLIIRSAVENAEHIVYITDSEGLIEYVNPSFTAITGFTKEEAVGRKSNILKSGVMPEDYYKRLWDTISLGGAWKEEIINKKKNGELYYAFQIITPIFDDQHKIIKFIAIQNDITDRKQAEERIRHLTLEYESIFNNVQDAIFLLDVEENGDFRFVRLNPQHEKLTGLTTDLVRGRTPQEIAGEELGAQLAANYRNCLEKREPVEYEETLALPGGVMTWSTKLSPVFRDDKIVQIVGSARDITKEKELLDNLKILSTTDTLTKAYNRNKMAGELEYEVSRASRYRTGLSLIMFDIDHFKKINDNFGHDIGDEVLKSLVDITNSVKRENDILARWGGEEFLLLCPDTGTEGAAAIAERLRESVEKHKFEKDIRITLSLGVAGFDPGSQNIDSLLKASDDALYESKRSGRNRVKIADIPGSTV